MWPAAVGNRAVPAGVNGAGGGTRTLKLFRARAPKAGVYANSTTPARPRSYRLHWQRVRLDGFARPNRERYLLGVSTTRRRRPALIALVMIAACGCLALGWWQWTRFQSASGSFQNLGYALAVAGCSRGSASTPTANSSDTKRRRRSLGSPTPSTRYRKGCCPNDLSHTARLRRPRATRVQRLPGRTRQGGQRNRQKQNRTTA